MVSEDMEDIKLVDFNTACSLERGALTSAGDRRTAPPEVFKGESPMEGADVWGVGLCLYFLLTGHLPQGRDKRHLDEAGLRKAASRPVCFAGPLWENVTVDCKSFLGVCLALRPEDRPSVGGLYSLPFLLGPTS